MNRNGFVRRFIALLRKEVRQMLRDKSNMAVGLLLPAALILLFGYGLSFDVKHAPVAVVMEDVSPIARQVVDGLSGSSYLSPVWTRSMADAEARMRAGEVDGIVRIPPDFSRRLAAGDARVQLVLNGANTTTAQTLEGYVGGAIGTWMQRQADRAGNKPPGAGGVEVVQRMWFNEAGSSTWYLVPGLVVLVLTLIGAFLTSLLIAREWERGTFEPLFVTPVRPTELVLAKLAPYLVIGAIDLALCLLAAKFLFEVPMRGSLLVIGLTSMLYLTVSLLLGLFISGVTRNQFQASQVALLTSFLPAMMLSGFVFDLRNVPLAIQVVSNLLPATHFMGLVKTLFLAGDDWPAILRSTSILTGYAVALAWATRRTLRKKLD
ncbi:Inner membrane transport permease YbhS [Pigmentiphaga humi]|uniref:Inner membrane transport permease YbhS n=1 Tax=Pigmentiphaga humi TaxID=2478468 RepID=A0A3P4B329_9BURK|nr:ABC transporter permease [Pigmentiphaga humi]VCU70694.1 Inner membrane transport permease YbhS [Pigmentiphaga humi]